MPGPVTMDWCSDGTPHSETFPENSTQSDARYRADCVAWIEQLLAEFPPSDDCP